ncbi:MAG: FAD-dependent oxidoreductase [Clostridia bacterium]|nr:FAD-dependent oxidoreductase [Clostridia bacterium]
MNKVSLNIEAKVYGEFDVVVCGGGTAGVIAALAAARNGAKTVLIEDSYFLGGMLTMGNAGITKSVMHGIDAKEQLKINKELAETPEKVQIVGGIPLEMINELVGSGKAIGNYGTGASYVYTDSHSFKLYLFDKLLEAGVKVMLRSRIFSVIKNDDRICGVCCHTKEGALVVYGKYFIDATGDGDVAALSGAKFRVGASAVDEVVKEGLIPEGTLHEPGSMYRIGGVDFERLVEFLEQNPDRFREHGFGLMSWEEFKDCFEKGEAIVTFCPLKNDIDHKFLGRFQIYNTPHKGVMIGCTSIKKRLNGLIEDELTQAEHDVLAIASEQLEVIKAEYPGFENAFIMDVPMAGIRETRHIDGEYLLTIEDILKNKDFEDTIGLSSHPVDIYPKPACCEEVIPPERAWFRIPYRSLVTKGIDNLFVAGRCISATRDASGCIRPTIPCMIGGEAVGTAAAILCKDSITKAKDINIQKLRATLKANCVVL